MSSPTPDWISGFLQTQLSQEEWDQVKPFLETESWLSPAFFRHDTALEDIPLRCRLEIDVTDHQS